MRNLRVEGKTVIFKIIAIFITTVPNRDIILYWKNHLAMITEIPSWILSQYLWYNANIQVDKTSIHFSRFSEKNINYVSQLFNSNSSGMSLRENTIYIRILIFNGYN